MSTVTTVGEVYLTNREIASLVVLFGFVVLVVASSRRAATSSGIIRSLGSALKLLTTPKILVPFGLYVGWVGAALVPAARFGLWHTQLWKETVLWGIFSGVSLFGKGLGAATETGVFARAFKRLVVATVYFEFVANLASFPLWIEIPAQFLGALFVMVTTAAGRDPQNALAVRVANVYLSAFGMAAIGWGTWSLASSWSDVDTGLLWRGFVLPLWLTPVALAFLYPLAGWSAYESVSAKVRFGAKGERTGGAMLAIAVRSAYRLSILRMIDGPAAWRIGRTGGFGSTWRAVGDVQREHRERVQSEAAAQKRLERNAGLVGVDSAGKQLDQREHAATMEGLRDLAFCQMGHYRRRGQSYEPDFDAIIDGLSDKYELPRPNEIMLRVSNDGQSWYAQRETITGHWFAIGAAGPPSDQWLYDGSSPPAGFPDESEWDQWAPGDNAPNWD